MKIPTALLGALMLAGTPAFAGDAMPADRAAQLFGQREAVHAVNLSPDGTKIVFIAAGPGAVSSAVVAPVAGGKPVQVAVSDGDPFRLSWCDWISDERVICQLYAVTDRSRFNTLAPFTRLMAFDADGRNVIGLGPKSRVGFEYDQQFDGTVIHWGRDGTALIARDHAPERAEVNRAAMQLGVGYGVDRVDLRTGKAKTVEYPDADAVSFLADSDGAVRIKGERKPVGQGKAAGYETLYSFRAKGSDGWRPLSRIAGAADMEPLAIAEDGLSMVAAGEKDGRTALYRVGLVEGGAVTLLVANDRVDVDTLQSLGRRGKIISASWVTDKRERLYFDPELETLAYTFYSSLPNHPQITFESASEDGRKLVFLASSDVDPGTYYYFDRDSRQLTELLGARPALGSVELARVKPVRYKAADGTEIPAYLTLPAAAQGRTVPAIVLPHGGPSSRDEWGFDWLAQFFAARGYAVLQPNYRGSAGYGDDWFVNNGFKSWDIAIGDINAGARWLVESGVATAAQLAIVGWSYGGYAALQGGAEAPDLYKAIVAIAPVSDLELLKNDSRGFDSYKSVRTFIGSGEHIAAGSPRRRADRFQAPVLMFSGDRDLNVNVRQARGMEEALRRAGKPVELVVFPGLDHQLVDTAARTAMLTKAEAFLRQTMRIGE